ncbi:Acetylglutamate kinase [Crocosphaera watsonii WH 0402]|uniref:Acetylglutamate kinase n=1 Tax=Crocosphaera watsonii WH 0402 TaxID=1284629 RepID=T2JVY5_CROWT|nr:Acetylglutamate kinase [Crocosphaera watsonii WH 0402]
MKDSSLKDKVIRDIIFLACVGVHPVVVHGGGPRDQQLVREIRH